MKKYITLFLKTRFVLIFGCATALFVLFFSVLLFDRNAVYPPIFALWVYFVAIVFYAINLLVVLRFQRVIAYQERLFDIRFCDTNATPLYKGSIKAPGVFLSDDWLIFAGKSAFCRQYIKHIDIKSEEANMGNDYRLRIYTVDYKEYSIHIDSPANARRIQIWYKNQ